MDLNETTERLMEEKLYTFEEVKEIVRITVKETLEALNFKIVLPEEEQK